MHHSHVPHYDTDHQTARRLDDLIDFLTARLTEDLARIWTRQEQAFGNPSRPGAAAQLAVVDKLLRTLSAGKLPARFELRLLLFGYSLHPDYEQRWAGLLQDDSVARP
jgi:hypothetical protein